MGSPRLDRVDDFLMRGKPMRRVFRKNRRAVDDDVEDAPLAGDDFGVEPQLAGKRGSQTGRLRAVVSANAVFDQDEHDDPDDTVLGLVPEYGAMNTGLRAVAIAAALVSLVALGRAEQAQPRETIPGPAGTHTENGLAGYAKILCSGVFVSGRAPEEVAHGSAYFFMPQAEQSLVKWSVDRDAQLARASLGATTRVARSYGDQGCIIDHPDKPGIHFKPVAVTTRLPDAMSQPWPMGDRADSTGLPSDIDREKLEAAVDAAFADPAAMTAAFLVVHKGQIIAERYAPGITRDTQLESWSMGKSLAATLFALLVKDGRYSLEQPAPVPLWRRPGDPRGAIRNIDLLRMSAGLKFLGNQEPGASERYPDHYYIYTGAIDAFDYSITRPQEYPPNTDGRYRNSDPLTIAYLTKIAVETRGEQILTWPQRALFDKIGIRRQVLETDPYGNFLISGYDYGTARNWARIGLLYLQDGVWQGQRLLPEGWSTFVSTPAPAWKRPEYGGFFWLNRVGSWNLPPDAYFAAGAGGQNTWIVPSHQLVVVRMGHMRGQGPARRATNSALGLVMDAIGAKSGARREPAH
jgi:CubicO group peptidase (beta-lactamase class C family)